MFKIKIKKRKIDEYVGKKVAYCREYFNVETADSAGTITNIENDTVYITTSRGDPIYYTIAQVTEYLAEGSWMIIKN